MKNAELIKALRYCADATISDCDGCPYQTVHKKNGMCIDKMVNDAADAIEALQAKCDRLEQKCKAQQERNEEYCEKQTYIDKWGAKWMTSAKDVPSAAYQHGFCDGQAYEQQTTAEAQMPKRGVDEIPKRIMGYDTEKLLLFAKMCEENDVTEHDLKQAAWNLEFAVRAVANERMEIIKNTMDEIKVRFTPDFEKAYEEMMPNCGARMRGEHDEQ